ncbi:MAG TPA: Ig-like domain-containing protein [Mycobacteriales bacterium]|nr:Ig-like domain-containing protein [Mycobacteriales bacterium]
MNRAEQRGVRQGGWLGLLALVLVLVAACTGSSGGASAPGSDGGNGGKAGGGDAPAATVAIEPAGNATGVAPGSPVVVKASGGTLSAVTVSGKAGKVKGSLDGAKTTWTSIDKLAFGATYSVTATATNAGGKATNATSKFTTVKAKAQVFPAVAPLRDSVVGVGLPIRVYFNAPVTDKKAAIDHLKVSSSVPVDGAWHWFSNTEVHYRPQKYWPAHDTIALDISLYGVDLGGGTWGGLNANRHIQFTTSDSHVSIADTRTHQMKVYTNGKLVRTLPASMGKEVPGRYTHSGPHVVIDKNRVKTMDSRTFGLALDAGGYTAKVEWATRISNNGEFAHSAPWSVAQQGHSNVSHGCINLSPSNAQWFFNYSKVGDVVEVVGTPVKLGPKDGDIFDWTIPWSQWVS